MFLLGFLAQHREREMSDRRPETPQDRLARVRASFEESARVKRETLELVRAYYHISDPAARKRLFELTKAIANAAS